MRGRRRRGRRRRSCVGNVREGVEIGGGNGGVSVEVVEAGL